MTAGALRGTVAPMTDAQNQRLAWVLRGIGVLFIVFFTLAFIGSATKADMPDLLYRMTGWGDIGDAEEQMISIVYIVWGFFLWAVARDPGRNKLFVDFTLVANVAHFGLMGVQAFTYSGEHTHLLGDVPLGFAILAALAVVWLPVRSRVDA
jgi:hypothetical protein